VEMAMAYFKVQLWHLYGRAERNHERLVRIFNVLAKILNRRFLNTSQKHYCLSQFISWFQVKIIILMTYILFLHELLPIYMIKLYFSEMKTNGD
jgi:hypothetical protein